MAVLKGAYNGDPTGWEVISAFTFNDFENFVLASAFYQEVGAGESDEAAEPDDNSGTWAIIGGPNA